MPPRPNPRWQSTFDLFSGGYKIVSNGRNLPPAGPIFGSGRASASHPERPSPYRRDPSAAGRVPSPSARPDSGL